MPQPDAASAEMEREQLHVDRVYERLEATRARARAYEAEGHRRAQFGHEGGLVERDSIVYQAAVWLQRLDAEEEGLVFGRLDFEDGEIQYIGRLGVRDEDYNPLTVDWRAPAAAVFYQATPVDRRDVVRRRTIKSAGRRVTRLDDDLLAPESPAANGLTVIGDGALMAALTRKRGTVMHDIVATIQREQDLAVRSPGDGATLITGGPGTGKTAVALHRAAYLLFNERRRFESGGVLIVGPSRVFTAYVEQVLPSLGEHTAALRSLGELLDGVHASRHDPAPLAAIKGSISMLPILERAVRSAPPGVPDSFRTTYQGNVVQLDRRALDRVRSIVLGRGTPGGGPQPNAQRAHAATALLEAAWERLPRELRDRRRTERAHFDRELRDRTEFDLFIEQWWPYRSPAEVLRGLADGATLRALAGPDLADGQIAALEASWRRDEDAAPDWSVEDVPLLAELDQLLGPVPAEEREPEDPFADAGVMEVSSWVDRNPAARRDATRETYAHVIVDEGQDLSPMQWRVLGRLGRRASWTVVGDPVQSSWPDPEESRLAMELALGDQRRYRHELRTNYRNSAEIYEYAARFAKRAMPDVELPEAVRKTGFPPEEFDDLDAAVRAALGAVEGTVGVITTLAAFDAVSARLAASLEAEPRLVVLTDLDAKGLEYDAAVVLDPDAIAGESPAGLRTLYVALTRATQRLYVVSPD
ncbi:UvrD-helicase domain-containing protein [Actinospica sp. MGRD01-02]|uniref:UvrD-helicase domain-containing protein n=1 Tax=Actinospica acidithermotolerans TaxID=2828514 RepID=A0A941IKE4_9ACTN|nr:UvrD-helicase domain-containing protein [Actinospica acidithermotolerans]MBR7830489.1 UvrD-helicase domain-containing protein [Actinospica acidithermotolerans]